MVMPSGDTAIRGAGSGRGVFAGQEPSANSIDMIEIASTGNATDFGDITRSKQAVSETASSSRGLLFVGYS